MKERRKRAVSVHNVKGQENGSRDRLGETNRSEIQEALLASIKPYMLNNKQATCNYTTQMQCL